ncbi:MAG: hypothetical protein J6C04_04310 [Oscillospiraceae bacterium]|nr:hypothetical protein [Oscillospiraceae bacterium]
MSEQKILATVDGVNITDAEVDAFIASLPREQQMYAQNPDFMGRFRSLFLKIMILMRLIIAERQH